MAFRIGRRFVSVLTTMLFVFSIAANGIAMTNWGLKAPAAVATATTPANGSMDCDGEDMPARAACAAACAAAVAILCEPTLALVVATTWVLLADLERRLPGRGVLPEPHPPKPVGI
jgi:hypothetical protein